MAHERIKPRFMNITEDKLWGVCVYLCLSVKAPVKACGLFVCMPSNNVY